MTQVQDQIQQLVAPCIVINILMGKRASYV